MPSFFHPRLAASKSAPSVSHGPSGIWRKKILSKFYKKNQPPIETFQNSPSLKEHDPRPLTKMIRPVQQAIDSIKQAGAVAPPFPSTMPLPAEALLVLGCGFLLCLYGICHPMPCYRGF
jgi:hypothetical protein